MRRATVITVGDLTIDPVAHLVQLGGGEISLTPLEYSLLVTMAQYPNRVFSRETLLREVWGYTNITDTRLVNVHVQRLRSKVERNADHPQMIVTVRGIGYRINGRKADHPGGARRSWSAAGLVPIVADRTSTAVVVFPAAAHGCCHFVE